MTLDAIDALNQNPLLSPFQHSFISSLTSVIQSTPAPALDRERAKAEIGGKRNPTIRISLPHRTNVGQRLEIFIEPEAVVFSYDYDHMHLGNGEPDPSVEKALDFAVDLLEGRIEVELSGWLVAAGVTTYRRAANGTREKLQSGGYLGFISVPFRRTTRRISFE